MTDQHTKKTQHPGEDGLSTSTDPKEKKTQHSKEGEQVIYQHHTINNGLFRHETPAVTPYQKTPLETM